MSFENKIIKGKILGQQCLKIRKSKMNRRLFSCIVGDFKGAVSRQASSLCLITLETNSGLG